MVNFQVTTDFKDVDRMLRRYSVKAVAEYSEAVRQTVIHGLRIAPESTPIGKRGTGTLKKSWKHEIKGLSGSVYNTKIYASMVDSGWKRTKPIYPKGKILIFATQDWKRSKAPSTTTLLKTYKSAMKKLKGKDMTPRDKSMLVTKETGVVVTNKVTKPAHFKGYGFIKKNIYPRVQARFEREVYLANKRLLA